MPCHIALGIRSFSRNRRHRILLLLLPSPPPLSPLLLSIPYVRYVYSRRDNFDPEKVVGSYSVCHLRLSPHLTSPHFSLLHTPCILLRGMTPLTLIDLLVLYSTPLHFTPPYFPPPLSIDRACVRTYLPTVIKRACLCPCLLYSLYLSVRLSGRPTLPQML